MHINASIIIIQHYRYYSEVGGSALLPWLGYFYVYFGANAVAL